MFDIKKLQKLAPIIIQTLTYIPTKLQSFVKHYYSGLPLLELKLYSPEKLTTNHHWTPGRRRAQQFGGGGSKNLPECSKQNNSKCVVCSPKRNKRSFLIFLPFFRKISVIFLKFARIISSPPPPTPEKVRVEKILNSITKFFWNVEMFL